MRTSISLVQPLWNFFLGAGTAARAGPAPAWSRLEGESAAGSVLLPGVGFSMSLYGAQEIFGGFGET